MPAALSYPGVYVEEIPSGVRTITGVATSITAFIGRASRGPVNKATTINSYGDFERIFGGLWVDSSLGYAVRDFYLNGGSQAIIVRLFNPTFADEAARQAALAAATTQAQTAAAAVSQAATAAVAGGDTPTNTANAPPAARGAPPRACAGSGGTGAAGGGACRPASGTGGGQPPPVGPGGAGAGCWRCPPTATAISPSAPNPTARRGSSTSASATS